MPKEGFVGFCKVFTEQVREHGRTHRALEETFRICQDKKILEDYLKQREGEIMDIMTLLFDQDYATQQYARHAREEGIKEGIKEVAVKLLESNMSAEIVHQMTNLSFDEISALQAEISR